MVYSVAFQPGGALLASGRLLRRLQPGRQMALHGQCRQAHPSLEPGQQRSALGDAQHGLADGGGRGCKGRRRGAQALAEQTPAKAPASGLFGRLFGGKRRQPRFRDRNGRVSLGLSLRHRPHRSNLG
ncbi:hypothetical protein [Thiocapsa sp.]|uniref:hypothetical protein n=1 Tax=Thiocapsa sp. TaxID=2024551 RepID=UPI0035934FC8